VVMSGDWSEYWLVVMSGTGRSTTVGGDVSETGQSGRRTGRFNGGRLAALAEMAAIPQLVRGLSAATSGDH
jgi:hypothetical protein